jgi:hypothetical protein
MMRLSATGRCRTQTRKGSEMHLTTATIETTPTHVNAWNYESPGRIIQNTGSETVFLGDAQVSANGATPALSLAPGTTLTLPRGGLALYGVVAEGAGHLTVLLVGHGG